MKYIALLLLSIANLSNNLFDYSENSIYFVDKSEQLTDSSYKFIENITDFFNTTTRKINNIKIYYRASINNKDDDKFLAARRTYIIYEFLKNKLTKEIIIYIIYDEVDISSSYAVISAEIER